VPARKAGHDRRPCTGPFLLAVAQLEAHGRVQFRRAIADHGRLIRWSDALARERPCDLDFAVSGTETITALGILLDTDHERRMALRRDASGIPVAIEFDTEDPCDDPRIQEPRRAAVMRITLPRSIPAQFWSDNFDVPDREYVTSIGYGQMQEVIKNTWRHWIG
jgi:hypothetical protein